MNYRNFLKGFGLAALVIACMGVEVNTIKWYSETTAATSLTDSMILSLEKPSPHRYEYTTLASLRGYTGTNTLIVSSNVYTTNLFTTNLYSSNIFTTNLFSTNVYTTNLYSSNAFITNLYATTTYTTNLYTSNLFATNIFSTNIYTTNLYTSNLFTTNLYSTNAWITNLYSTNAFITNLTVNNFIALTSSVESLVVSNGISFLEHIWGGPTNQLTLSTNEYYYVAYTPCAVTNLAVWMGAGYAESALLAITNASDSNITFTVHSPIRIPYGETSRTYTITNGDVFFGSFRKGAHGMAYVPRGFWQP